jgi:protein-S-isoprenylcysteine O-methyltransferase Ste14
MQRMTVTAKSWFGLAVVTVMTAVVLFGGAGTLAYWQAWIYLAIYASASALTTAWLARYDLALLERRLYAGPTAEPRPAQKIVMWIASVGFVGTVALPALDRRWAWSHVPAAVTVFGDVLCVLAFLAFFVVFRENSYSAATVAITPGQRVVSTGPYAYLRHPMYAGGLLLFFGTPLALASWWGLVAAAVTLPALVWRLFDEEQLLARDLPGYAAYCARVRWRLLPGVF